MRLSLLILLTIIASLAALTAIPPMVSYQGKLTKADGTLLPDGTYTMEFSIYDVPTDGRALWWESNPAVQVKKGLFSVLLGSVVNLPANIFDNQNRYFGVKVGTDAEMSPRQQIASVPFAFRAASAGTVDDGTITKAKLAPDATSDISDALKTGWVSVNDTWLYKSVNQVTISTDVNSIYSVGDKIRFKQDGAYKYFYIIVLDSPTQLQLTGGSTYSITNSPITEISYSKVSSPVGFPTFFNKNGTVDNFWMLGRLHFCSATTVVTTNTQGDTTIQFADTFPNTAISVVITNGDAGVNGGNLLLAVTSIGQSYFNLNAKRSSDNVAFQGNVRVNYLAIGY